MNHYTLRFDSEPKAEAMAEKLGYIDDGNLKAILHDGDIHPIGTVVAPAVYDENGQEITPPRTLPGFYVNLSIRDPLPPALAPFRVPYGSGGSLWSDTEAQPGAWPPADPA